MILDENEKKFLLFGNIKEDLFFNKTKALPITESIISKYLYSFGIPYKKDSLEISNTESNLNGQFLKSNRKIVIFRNNLTENNFKTFFTLMHESTHLLQYFILDNKISRNNIDKIKINDFCKMCQKFYHDNNIYVTADMFERFKQFVKTEPILDNNILCCTVHDMIKYSKINKCYYNNLCEIMANEFATKELGKLSKNLMLTEAQCKKFAICCDDAHRTIDKISPKTKIFSLFLQSIMTIPHNHIKCLIALMKMHLPIVVKNPQNMLSELQISMANDVENIKEYIIPSEQKQKETNSTKILELQIDDKENITSEIADYVLSDDITYECYQDVDQNINKDKDNDNKEEMTL